MSASGVSSSFLTPMRRVLFVTGVGFGVLLPLGTAAGWLAGGSQVGLGILLGMTVPAVFFGLTVVAGVLAAKLDNGPFVGVVMTAWLVKVVALLILMVAIQDATFYRPAAFLVAFLVGLVGWLSAEVVVVLRTRVPYVEIAGGR